MTKLSVKRVQSIDKPGLHGDGGGLYLRVGPTGSKSWILRTVIHGKRREIGLGSCALVTLSEAREAALSMRREARSGRDPLAVRRRKEMTFEEAARTVHEANDWAPGHAKRWIGSLEQYAFPHFGDRPIETITPSDVLWAVEGIWTEKHDTARRVLQRIGVIFDWAKTAGHYQRENPTVGLARGLPKVRAQVQHMPALPWRELPDFMNELSEREGMSARALEFGILTCLRSREFRGARWEEIDNATWSVPALRMKHKKLHKVPLSSAAMEVLERVRGLDPELVFPSAKRAIDGTVVPMSDTVFRALFQRMGRSGFVTHGFRSTFRDWCSENAHAAYEVSEAALAHKVGTKVEQAYARSDLFERRRDLMERWGAFATGSTAKVVRLHG